MLGGGRRSEGDLDCWGFEPKIFLGILLVTTRHLVVEEHLLESWGRLLFPRTLQVAESEEERGPGRNRLVGGSPLVGERCVT